MARLGTSDGFRYVGIPILAILLTALARITVRRGRQEQITWGVLDCWVALFTGSLARILSMASTAADAVKASTHNPKAANIVAKATADKWLSHSAMYTVIVVVLFWAAALSAGGVREPAGVALSGGKPHTALYLFAGQFVPHLLAITTFSLVVGFSFTFPR